MIRKSMAIFLLLIPFLSNSQVFISDNVTGNIYREAADKSVEGSPFFIDDWSKGVIYMKDGSKADKFLLKLDALRNELIFLHDGQILSVVNPVKEFVLMPSDTKQLLFRCGFPAFERYDENSFYQVLQDGPTSLLKMNRKSIKESTAFNQGLKKEYILNETYYIVKPGRAPIRIKKDKSSLLEALGDGDGKLPAWMSKNGNRCRSEDDMAAVVKIFNEGGYK
ncbi:MAG: hypothetical protein IPP79_10350 [Chitinophagaceae bacterium]|nr:hypothetical protein [Chitinophagaceae bacterium]